MGRTYLDPTVGNVSFGSGKDQWAFSLTFFSKFYSKKFGIEEEKLMKKLWGDNYYDTKAKKWKTDPNAEDGSVLKRTFA